MNYYKNFIQNKQKNISKIKYYNMIENFSNKTLKIEYFQ